MTIPPPVKPCARPVPGRPLRPDSDNHPPTTAASESRLPNRKNTIVNPGRSPARHQVRDLQNPAATQFRHPGAGFAGIRKTESGDLAAGRLSQMMHVISQRQRLEHVQRRHAGFREAVADLVRHLPAQFAEDVADAARPIAARCGRTEWRDDWKRWGRSRRAGACRAARESDKRRPGCRVGPRWRARPGSKPPDKSGCAGNRR